MEHGNENGCAQAGEKEKHVRVFVEASSSVLLQTDTWGARMHSNVHTYVSIIIMGSVSGYVLSVYLFCAGRLCLLTHKTRVRNFWYFH